MKATGIVRKVDELGRVVIPIELRRTLGIAERDALEIYTDEDRIVLRKYEPTWTCRSSRGATSAKSAREICRRKPYRFCASIQKPAHSRKGSGRAFSFFQQSLINVAAT